MNALWYHRNEQQSTKEKHSWSSLFYKKVLFTAVEQSAKLNPFLVSHLFDTTLSHRISMPTNAGFCVQYKPLKRIRPHGIISGEYTGRCCIPLLSLPFVMFLQCNAAQTKTNFIRWWQKDLRNQAVADLKECHYHGKTPQLMAGGGSGGLNKTPLVSIFLALEGKPYAAKITEPFIPISGSLQAIMWVQGRAEETLHC